MIQRPPQQRLHQMGFTKRVILPEGKTNIISFLVEHRLIVSRNFVYVVRTSELTKKVIKSGGYKISALDIEREILNMPYISEVMVVGAEDEEFGQRVAAAIVLRDGVSNLIISSSGSVNRLIATSDAAART